MEVSAAPASSLVPPPAATQGYAPAGDPASVASVSSFAYQPALDGVRGLAVTLVVLFHAGYSWTSGGYVGVSVFFTLSGYLITSLALHEWAGTGRLDVVAFYARRIRRLLPASLVCLALVVAAASAGAFDGVTRVRRDLWSALGQVYNWVTLAGGEDYATQMARVAGQRAPLDHYWSLSIEEQFYWVWPLALLAILRSGRRRRVVAVVVILGVCTATTVAVAALAGDSATYLATPARLPEILAGAVLAVVLFSWPVAARLRRGRRGPLLGLVGLGAIAWAATTWPGRSGPAYDGWLPLFSVASVALIAGLGAPSPLRTALAWAPLVGLGRISYGVYLFHWPIFTLVDERLIDDGRTTLFAVRMVLTLAIAVASYRLIETPIRRPRRARERAPAGASGGRTFGAAGAACIAVAMVIIVVPDRGGSFTYVAEETVAAVALAPIAPDDVRPTADDRPVRVMVIGDSTAVALGSGMTQWAFDHPGEMQVTTAAAVGCGLNVTGELPDNEFRAPCLEVHGGLVSSVARLRPDVVVAMVTMSDIEDRRWSDGDGPLAITDPRFADHLFDAYVALTAALLDAGAGDVVWLVPPTPRIYTTAESAWAVDPDRFAAYHAVLDRVAAWSEQVTVGDVPAWIAGLDESPERDDGLHWTLDGAVRVTGEYLVPLIRVVAGP